MEYTTEIILRNGRYHIGFLSKIRYIKKLNIIYATILGSNGRGLDPRNSAFGRAL